MRENEFPSVKKMAKNSKNRFHAHFWFSRGKIITLPADAFRYITVQRHGGVPNGIREVCSYDITEKRNVI